MWAFQITLFWVTIHIKHYVTFECTRVNIRLILCVVLLAEMLRHRLWVSSPLIIFSASHLVRLMLMWRKVRSGPVRLIHFSDRCISYHQVIKLILFEEVSFQSDRRFKTSVSELRMCRSWMLKFRSFLSVIAFASNSICINELP